MFDLCIKQNAELGYLQLPCSEELEHLLLITISIWVCGCFGQDWVCM